jgi:ABC-type uncharacterized transport system substrate-binding protein
MILLRLFALLLPLLVWSLPAKAHPHVWIAVTSEVIFKDGKIAGIRHHWTFDDMYSAFVTANIGDAKKGPTSADLEPIAKTNVSELKEFSYFTFPKEAGRKIGFGEPTDISMTYDAKTQQATLHFTLPVQGPITGRAFAFQIYDPSYFVAFGFEKGDGAVKLIGAPQGCSLTVTKPKSLDEEESKKLNESFFSGLSPGADFGIKLADRALVACP